MAWDILFKVNGDYKVEKLAKKRLIKSYYILKPIQDNSSEIHSLPSSVRCVSSDYENLRETLLSIVKIMYSYKCYSCLDF